MNERIKELEAQCWEPRQYGPAWFNSTKFAELIVKETINEMCELHCETIDRLKHSIREAMYLLDQPEPRVHAAFSELLCALNPKLRETKEQE